MLFLTSLKKPNMPDMNVNEHAEDEKNYEKINVKRASELQFNFFKDVVYSSKCPEHNGCHPKICREQGHSVRLKTNVVYFPMIDEQPSSSSLIMNDVLKAVTLETGQKYAVFTADQQLYKVAVHIL